jgi:hypothetical protein
VRAAARWSSVVTVTVPAFAVSTKIVAEVSST